MKSITIAVLLLSVVGCGQVDNAAKSVSGFLDRTVTLYDANGKPIKTWQTNNTVVGGAGPTVEFIDKNGVNVRISGTFIIEGK